MSSPTTPTVPADPGIEETTVFSPRLDRDGLMPAVVTDADSGQVLMLAFMNAEALARSLDTGFATFWSRSRQAFWVKGETSGNRLQILEARTDCDQDTIWLRVRVEGHGAACHTGRRTCFYRVIGPRTADGSMGLRIINEPPLFDPDHVYDKSR